MFSAVPKSATPSIKLGSAGVTLQAAAPGTPFKMIVLMVVTQALVFVASTQYLAFKLAYQAELGVPLTTVLGHSIYEPWLWGLWALQFWGIPAFREFALPLVLIQVGWLFGLVGYMWFSGLKKPKAVTKSTLHGSAHWATDEELVETGLLDMTFDIEPLGGAPTPTGFLKKASKALQALKKKAVGFIWID